MAQSYAERRKLQLREEIIDAAIDVFTERGYHDAGVADIAARVGIGHSTFYRHFESKREILDQVITTVLKRSVAALAAENAPGATTIDQYRAQVHRIAKALADIAADLRGIRLLLSQAADINTENEDRIFSVFESSAKMTARYFDNGIQRGYLRSDLSSRATARAVVGMIVGTAIIGLNPRLDQQTRKETVNAAVRLMFDGIIENGAAP